MRVLAASTPSSAFAIVTNTLQVAPNTLSLPKNLPKRRIYVLVDGIAVVCSGTVQLLLGGTVNYEVPYNVNRGSGTMLCICGGFGTYDSNTPNALFGDFPTGGQFAIAPWEVVGIFDQIKVNVSAVGVTTYVLAVHSETMP